MHDTVEDGYAPRWLLNKWPALMAITREKGEPYAAYIERAFSNEDARAVKVRDLTHNLTRNGGPPRPSLEKRYISAWERLAPGTPIPKASNVKR
jgi:hypothetical protein